MNKKPFDITATQSIHEITSGDTTKERNNCRASFDAAVEFGWHLLSVHPVGSTHEEGFIETCYVMGHTSQGLSFPKVTCDSAGNKTILLGDEAFPFDQFMVAYRNYMERGLRYDSNNKDLLQKYIDRNLITDKRETVPNITGIF